MDSTDDNMAVETDSRRGDDRPQIQQLQIAEYNVKNQRQANLKKQDTIKSVDHSIKKQSQEAKKNKRSS